MKAIWKFSNVKVSDTMEVEVEGGQVLRWIHAQPTNNPAYVTLWAEVKVDETLSETAKLIARGTGHSFTGREGDHIVSLWSSGLMLHFYEYQPQTFYLAACEKCEMTMPFATDEGRSEWASVHTTGTGHTVTDAGKEIV